MRFLTQPGPVAAERIESFACDGREMSFRLQPGLSLNEALTRPLVAARMQSAALRFESSVLAPFVYVVPAQPRDELHVAYFSEPRTPGESLVEIATATFGWRDGAPFVHCHGAWTEPGGRRGGGHMMPQETFVHTATEVRAWAFADLRIAAEPDPETNFTLFHPLASGRAGGRFVVARIRPNEDICAALEEICLRHGIREAAVRGSLGSLVGARFADGGAVQDHATEVLVRDGWVRADAGELRAALNMLVVDMQGTVHEGWLMRGENPVCITFELVLEALG
jgi:predicted DNA-binding protein with PD1-like motif